ncbi:MAG: translocation/assembly module TamB domain-containing protein, partial [Planctomycetota bacterium]
YVEEKLGDALGRPVALGELEAGWTKGVALRSLSVANRGAEFGEEALLEIASVSVTDSLTQLVFGGGPTRIVIDGLVLRVEEQAGGRTNVDDLLERLAAPKPPPPKPEVEPPPPPPLQLELRHCTLQFRRLPYRAPPRRVDPFVEDAVIRDADEGALRLGIERFDLTVAGGLERQTIRFAGGVAVNGKGGRVEGSIEIAGDEISGEVKADDLDLELLEPFLPFDLRGKLDLEVSGGGAEGLDLALRVEGLHLEGEKLPTVTEEWIDLRANVRRTDDGVTVETLGLSTASGEVELEAGGSWPLAEGAPFHVRTRLPSRLLFARSGKERLRTTFHLEMEGTGTPDELDVVGKLSMPEMTFFAPELAKLGKGSGDLEFDVGVHDQRLEIRRFFLKGLRLDAKLAGTVSLTRPPVIDLAGKAAIDLALLHHLLEPFLELPDDAEIQGWLRTSDLVVRLDERRNAEVKADALVDGLLVEGVFDQVLRRDRVELRVDAALSGEGNVLDVRQAQLDDLRAVGRIVGLKEEKLRHAEGEIKGSLMLAATPLQVAGIEDIDRLAGTLTVDVNARTNKGCVKVAGSASIDRPLVEADGLVGRAKSVSLAGSAECDSEGRWETATDARLDELTVAGTFGEVGATITVDGGARDEGATRRAEAKVTLETVRAVGDFGDYRRDRLDQVGDKVSGDAALRGEIFTITAQVQDSERADLTVEVTDLERLNLALPADLELDGPLRFDGNLRREGDVWAFGGGARSGELTVRWQDKGLENEPVALTFKGREEAGGWAIEVPSLAAERGLATVQVTNGFLGRDGTLAAKVRLDLALELLASVLPDLAPRELQGTVETTATVAHDREWSIELDVSGKDLSTKQSREARTPVFQTGLQARARLGAGHLVLDPFALQINEAEFKGTGRIGDVLELTLDGSGPIGAAGLLPVKGEGDFTVQGLSVSLARDGPIHLQGMLTAAELQYKEVELLRPRVVFKITGRRDSAGLHDLKTDILTTAVKGHVDTVTAHGLVIHEKGHGELLFDGGGEGYRVSAVVKQKVLIVDQVKWNQVTLDLGGLIPDPFAEHIDLEQLTGDLAFEHWQLGPLPFTDATCKVRLRDKMIQLTGIHAKFSQGDVTGEAKLWPRGSDVKWWTHLKGRDIQLSKELGDPL